MNTTFLVQIYTTTLKCFFKKTPTLPLLLLFSLTFQTLQAQVTYVNVNATCGGSCDGSSWALAYPSLQTALLNTASGEIWVAQGTYVPSAVTRSVSFDLKSNVSIYGGFNGTETMVSQRAIENNPTILSGDINGDDGANFSNYGDNSYHVVRATNVTNTAVLDGFTIRGGNANSITFPDYLGGGFFNEGDGAGNSSQPILRNCTFEENRADLGGGIYNSGGNSGNGQMTLEDCLIQNNFAITNGGGMYNDGQAVGNANCFIYGCSFKANEATQGGGALFNYALGVGTVNPTIFSTIFSGNLANEGGAIYNDAQAAGNLGTDFINCTFSGNDATSSGGAIYNFGGFSGNCNPVFTNCIFWNNEAAGSISTVENSDAFPTFNYSLIEEATCPGTNSICDGNTIFNQDPNFLTPITVAAPTTTGDLRTIPCAPNVNTGDNAAANAVAYSFDVDTNSRILEGIVDMGAYEYNNFPIKLTVDTVVSAYNGAEVTCTGASDGFVNLVVTGGLMPYVFNWQTFGAVQNISNLAAGTYYYTVTDANNCEVIDSVTIDDPLPVTGSSVATTNYSGYNVSCPGASDGGLDLTPAGGVGNYTFQWSNAATSEDLTNIAADTFYVTIMDANGCTGFDTLELTEPPQINLSAVVSTNYNGADISCFDSADGAIDLTASGGAGGFSYQWNNGAGTNQDPSNLAAGTYTVTATDANGCFDTLDVTITPPTQLLATLTPTDISCVGSNDGTIDLTPTGGIAPYTFAWSNAAVSEDLSNLSPNTYYVTVTDANGCTYNDSATVSSPTPINLTLTEATPVACIGQATGSVDLTVTGGSGSFTYLWNTTATTEDISNLDIGTYIVTVTDGLCFEIDSITLSANPEITTALAITSNYNGLDVSCGNATDGAVNLTPAAGTPPYNFTWSNGSTLEDPADLPAGQNIVTITDANGCMVMDTIDLTSPPPINSTITITSNYSGAHVSCFGASDGAVDLTASGGAGGFSYNWDNGIGNVEDPNGLAAGTYNVTITDMNGCTATNTISLFNPIPVSANPTTSDFNGFGVSCNGSTDGSITLNPTGGAILGNYTYNWDNGIGNIENPTNLGAGTYNVTITDVNGCTGTASVTITEPTAISLNFVANPPISCTDSADGGIDLTPTGGAGAPYTYLWSNAATSEDITNLSSGTYSVTATDGNGCMAVDSFTLTNPTPINSTVIATSNYNGFNISCFGTNDGAADLTVTNGTPPYAFVWSSGETVEDPTMLSGNTNFVTITDASGCQIIDTITLTEPFDLLASIAESTPISCAGATDGALDLTVSGGVGGYIYNWDNGIGGLEDPAGLGANTYTVTVTDANNCADTATYLLSEPQPIAATTTVSDYNGFGVSCAGGSDGTITINATGGTGAYSYTWTGGTGDTVIATNLSANTYNVTITDVNGCTGTASATITQPTSIISILTQTQTISCADSADGAIDLNVVGGIAPYTFLWSNGDTTEDIDSLSANTYSVTITDANGCTDVQSLAITEPAAITVITTVTSNYNGVEVSCFGANDGSADLTVSNGTAPYTFAWSSGETVEDPTMLSGGANFVTITDVNGCQTIDTVTLTEPFDLLANISESASISCTGASDGALDLTASGGTMPYVYNWDNGIGGLEDPVGLAANTYTVTVTDANNCADTTSYLLSEPQPITVTTTTSDYNGFGVPCAGDTIGTITVNATGGTGAYAYTWTGGTGDTAVATNLSAAIYNVTITDANGCTATANDTITQPNSILGILTQTQTISCADTADGAIDLNVIGGVAPMTYLWNNNDTIEDIDSLLAGTYIVTVTDANSCTFTDSLTITEPTALTTSVIATSNYNGFNVSCLGAMDGSADLTVNGGTMPYSFSWSNGATIEDPTNLEAGQNFVTITDANGCTKMDTIDMTYSQAFTIADTVISNYNGFQTSCIDSTDGMIAITPSVVDVYTYQWSNGDTIQDPTNLAAGTYTVTVTNPAGCIDTASVTVAAADSIFGTISFDTTYNGLQITCLDSSDAAVSLAVTGGVSGYTYLWSNGDTTFNTANLSAGTHFVTVTDGNGCPYMDSVTVTNPDTIQTSITIISNYNGFEISCVDSMDGQVTTLVTGGAGGYAFLWDNGDTLQNALSLGIGTNYVTITDANGCQSTDSVTVTTQPPAITITINNFNTVCMGDSSGLFTSNATGGAGGFSYAWSSGDTVSNPMNLPAGTYILTVTDVSGCQATDTATIDLSPIPTANFTATDVCLGQTTQFIDSSSGGTAYSWDFQSDGIVDNNTMGDVSFQYGSPGSYTAMLVVTNNFGCADTMVQVLNINQITAMISGLDNQYCEQDDAVILVGLPAGGTFTGAGVINIDEFDPTFAGTGVHDITYLVTDSTGCPQTVTVSTEVFPNPIVDAGADLNTFTNQPIQIVAIGNNIVQYSWSPTTGLDDPTSGTPTTTLQETTTYTVTGIDMNGCATSDEVVVNVTDGLSCFRTRTAFTPNNDGVNDTWSIDCLQFVTQSVEIYTRFGQLVFQMDNYDNSWDGTYNGKELAEDTYYFVIRLEDKGVEKILKGTILLLR
jgi:gliding motility-associated-like protein